jgi:FMN phosphatase YigB (HAD superfamily)
MLERLGTPCYQTLFIDDQPGNLDMAERVGIETALYTSPEQIAEWLKCYGVEV